MLIKEKNFLVNMGKKRDQLMNQITKERTDIITSKFEKMVKDRSKNFGKKKEK